jgi:hypothetical protein
MKHRAQAKVEKLADFDWTTYYGKQTQEKLLADASYGRQLTRRRAGSAEETDPLALPTKKEWGNRSKWAGPYAAPGRLPWTRPCWHVNSTHCPWGATFPDRGGGHAPFSVVVVFRRRLIRHYLFRRIKCLGPHGVRRSTVCASSRNGLFVGKANSALRVRSCGLQVRLVLGPCQRRPRGLLSAFGPNPTLKLRWEGFNALSAPAQLP